MRIPYRKKVSILVWYYPYVGYIDAGIKYVEEEIFLQQSLQARASDKAKISLCIFHNEGTDCTRIKKFTLPY